MRGFFFCVGQTKLAWRQATQALQEGLGRADASHPSPSGVKRHAVGSIASGADERLSAQRSGRGAGRGPAVRVVSGGSVPIHFAIEIAPTKRLAEPASGSYC